METNESNLKPQPTGGLKLMTVFIAVLALHILVIGGFTVWQFLKPPASDDLAIDKNHKGAKIMTDATIAGDLSSTDTAANDKPLVSGPASADNSTPSSSTAADASAAPASIASSTASASTVLVPRPAPAPLNVTPPPTDNDASSVAANPTAQTPSGPIRQGPVINPPDGLAPPEPSDSTATTAPADSSTPVADGTPYTVKKGDSLARIAHRHHVALGRLKTANSLASDKLKIGQKLVIPNRAEKALAADAPAPAATPEMTSIETNASTSTSTNADASEVGASPASSPVATTTTKPAHAHKMTSGGHRLYTVVKGDTLIKIARRFRTTPTAIMTANNITNASRLSIGKKLHIPSGESRSAAAEAPAEQEARPAAHGQLANYVQ